MNISKKLFLTSIAALGLFSHVAKATTQELQDEAFKQIIAKNSPNLISQSLQNSHLHSMILNQLSLKDWIGFTITSKATSGFLYDKEFWQNYLSQNYQDVPQGLFENIPFIWINLNTAEDMQNRMTMFTKMQRDFFPHSGQFLNDEQLMQITGALVKLAKIEVSPARWVAEYLPVFEATKHPRDVAQYIPRGLQTIDAKLNTAQGYEKKRLEDIKRAHEHTNTLPKSIEIRLAFLSNFEDLMSTKPFTFNVGASQWQINYSGYNDLVQSDTPRETMLNFPFHFNGSQYQFSNNGRIIGHGRLTKVEPQIAQN